MERTIETNIPTAFELISKAAIIVEKNAHDHYMSGAMSGYGTSNDLVEFIAELTNSPKQAIKEHIDAQVKYLENERKENRLQEVYKNAFDVVQDFASRQDELDFMQLPKVDLRKKDGKAEIYSQFCKFLNTALSFLTSEEDKETVRTFVEENLDERQIVNAFQNKGWNAGFHLYRSNGEYSIQLNASSPSWTTGTNLYVSFHKNDQTLFTFDLKRVGTKTTSSKLSVNQYTHEFPQD